MSNHDLALVRGIDDTRATLRRWSAHLGPVIGEWAAKSLVVACGLLIAVYVIASLTTPDPTPLFIPGVTRPAQASPIGEVLFRNALVLALHGFACIAGFIAGSSMPLEAARRSGTWKVIHDWAGTLAIWFVILATGFSLVTQALILGHGTAAVAAQLGMSPGVLLAALSLHGGSRADRPLPTARGLARGEPPRPVERAARRDGRDRGHRRAGARRLRVPRDLRDPGRHPRVRRDLTSLAGRRRCRLGSGRLEHVPGRARGVAPRPRRTGLRRAEEPCAERHPAAGQRAHQDSAPKRQVLSGGERGGEVGAVGHQTRLEPPARRRIALERSLETEPEREIAGAEGTQENPRPWVARRIGSQPTAPDQPGHCEQAGTEGDAPEGETASGAPVVHAEALPSPRADVSAAGSLYPARAGRAVARDTEAPVLDNSLVGLTRPPSATAPRQGQ